MQGPFFFYLFTRYKLDKPKSIERFFNPFLIIRSWIYRCGFPFRQVRTNTKSPARIKFDFGPFFGDRNKKVYSCGLFLIVVSCAFFTDWLKKGDAFLFLIQFDRCALWSVIQQGVIITNENSPFRKVWTKHWKFLLGWTKIVIHEVCQYDMWIVQDITKMTVIVEPRYCNI